VTERKADNDGRGFRALLNWFKLPAPDGPPAPTIGDGAPLPARLGHYSIERKIGQGGMGVVYAARDEKLHRTVALKTMSAVGPDATARQRFWREARAAASVSHPNVCQIYEIGEDRGELFIAMELLDGAPLSDRLKQGALPVAEAVPAALGMLAALAALHERGVVHRDLKPSNVFLTPHGVKLLDFGLARPSPHDEHATAMQLTRDGAVMGTPHYMSPEQALGEPTDARTDLFAAGAILFEMLAGRPAFVGNTVMAILHATVYEEPPALTGSPAVAAVDRVIRRALAKRKDDRPPSAQAMADELADVRTTDSGPAPATRAMTRLVVLPFRMLRADPETDFLAFSLPDAITSSLSGVGSLIVRSSAVAARFASDTPDFKALAVEANVDRVVLGTLLRSDDQLRVTAQLVEAPGGTVLATHTVQSPLGDLFALQDDIARRVADALALPLGRSGGTGVDLPHHPRAYELYLRANELARTYDGLAAARELYERAIALDPGFAPAWARLGRCHRVIGKYIDATPGSADRAAEAFRRALELNPRLTIAHKLFANLEADIGQAERAIVRLLEEATRHGNDPELFAGLVHACRYAGLFDESVAAHAEARRLDPTMPTSIEQTLLMTGEIDRLVAIPRAGLDAGANDGIRVIALGLAGRRDDARAALARMADQPRIPLFRTWMAHLAAWLDRRPAEMLQTFGRLGGLAIFDDPEAMFQEGWLLCDVGEHERGLAYLEKALDRGYFAAPALTGRPQFVALRGNPAFESLVADAEAGRVRAQAAFRDAGGARLLGG
jgi:serine/threonine protein kinase/tetratricopeptide (TPR) repeat protein